MDKVKTDVLIIGGGGAGSRAAIEAIKCGADTTIICKGKYGTSGCTPNSASEWMAYGVALGLADPRDSRQTHFEDIVKMGAYVCHHNLARIIAYEAPERFSDLVDWGVEFLRESNGRFLQVMSDGATYPRACGVGADTGKQIMDALKQQVSEQDIRIIEDVMAIDLIFDKGIVVGAVGIDVNSLEITAFISESTIIATGGHGQLFSQNVFPSEMTGDGYAMALRAGAKLVNMEFMQIGPCVVTPFKFDIGGILWRLNPRLLNGRHEEFLKRYIPSDLDINEVFRSKSVTFPFTMRNISGYIDIASFTEIVEGRGKESQSVYFDLSHVPSRIIEEKASIPFRYFLEKGLDIRKEPLEITPSIQHSNGGILIGEKGETIISGLFAAGEAAGGQHGSDRPGGNSLADCQVFGARAGRFAAERSKRFRRGTSLKCAEKIEERIVSLLKSKGRNVVEEIGRSLKKMMWQSASVIRTEETMSKSYQRFLEYRRISDSQLQVDEDNLVRTIELRNMLDVGLVILKSAMIRRETRGSHYRADFPERNDSEWLRIIEIQLGKEDLDVEVKYPNMIIYP